MQSAQLRPPPTNLTEDVTVTGADGYIYNASSDLSSITGQGFSLTIEGDSQGAFHTNGKPLTVSGLSSLIVNIGSPNSQKAGVNSLYAGNGGSLNITADSVSIKTTGASLPTGQQDAISLHALAGTITIDTNNKGDISVVFSYLFGRGFLNIWPPHSQTFGHWITAPNEFTSRTPDQLDT